MPLVPYPKAPDKFILNTDDMTVYDRSTGKMLERGQGEAEASPQPAPEQNVPRDLSTRVLTPEQQQQMLQQTGMGSLQSLPTAQGVSPKPVLENVRDISGAAPLSSMVVDPAIDIMQGDTLAHVGKQYGVRPAAQMAGEALGSGAGPAGRFAGGVAANAALDLYDQFSRGELSLGNAINAVGLETVNNWIGRLIGGIGTGPSKTREPFVQTGKEALESATVKQQNVEHTEQQKRVEQIAAVPEQMRQVQEGIGEKGKEISWKSQAADVGELGKKVAKSQAKGEKEYDKTVAGVSDAEVKKAAQAQADDELAKWYKSTYGRDLHEGAEEGRKLAAGEFTPPGESLPQDPATLAAVWRPFQAVLSGVRGVRAGFTEQYENKVKPELEGWHVPSSEIEAILKDDLASAKKEGTAPPLHTGPVNTFLDSLRDIKTGEKESPSLLVDESGRPIPRVTETDIAGETSKKSPIVIGPNGERSYNASWLLGRSSELAQLLHSRSTPDPEKHVLKQIKAEIDKHLTEISPSYGGTTAQYANTARIGLFDLADEVGRAQRGLDIPKIVFSQPEAANLLVSRMGDTEKQQLRELTGLSMARAVAGDEPSSTLSHLLNRDNAATYEELFKGTGIPDTNRLFWYAKEANAFGDAIVKDPQLRQQAQQAVEQKARETLSDFSDKALVSFEADLKNWAQGTDSKAAWARKTLRDISPIRDSRQKVILLDQAIQQFSPTAKPGMPSDMTGAQELVKATRALVNKLPGPVAEEYQNRFQQAESLNDQMAIVRELGNDQNLTQGATKAIAALQKHFTPLDGKTMDELTSLYRSKYGEPPIPIRTPKDYAVAKLMRNDTTIAKSWFEKSLGFHLALGGLLSYVGHTPVWLAAEAAVGAGDKIRNTARKAFGESLRDEETARKFIDGLDNFKNPSQKEKLFRQFAGAAVSSALDDAENYLGVKP